MHALLLSVLLCNRAIAASPTYHRDVVPIVQKHCQTCHRPGEAAPMPLMTYKDVRPWAKAIRESVVSRRMPPWHAAPGFGKFANVRRLADEEIAALRDWVDGGSPEGKRKDSPKPLAFNEGWAIPKPDAVFEMPVEHDVPAAGVVDYQQFAVATGFTEDRWIQAIEVRPGNRSVVHHIDVILRPPGSKWLPRLKTGGTSSIGSSKERASTRTPRDEVLSMFAPGYPAQIFPEGQARLIPAGSELIFQLHYQPNGKAARDRSRIGLVYARAQVKERIHTIGVGNPSFLIPPGDPNYRVTASWPLFSAVRVLSIIPHMHLRGKSFDCIATYPDNHRQPLVKVPKWDRSWQMRYVYADPIELPEKTWIQCWAYFDNSANNPVNPDPSKEVRPGDQTTDEMMAAYVEVALPVDADPARALYRMK